MAWKQQTSARNVAQRTRVYARGSTKIERAQGNQCLSLSGRNRRTCDEYLPYGISFWIVRWWQRPRCRNRSVKELYRLDEYSNERLIDMLARPNRHAISRQS